MPTTRNWFRRECGRKPICTQRDCVSEFRAVGDYLERWSYGQRKRWELEQLDRLGKMPVIGALAKRLLWKLVRDGF